MRYRIEYGGGLGDIINQIYKRYSYQFLNTLNLEDLCDIILITHNPFAKEIFEYHPKKDNFVIHDIGYIYNRSELEKVLASKNLSMVQIFNPTDGEIIFYESETDKKEKEGLSNYLVLAPQAGTKDRDLPESVVEVIVNELKKETDFKIVLVGRTYERKGKNNDLTVYTKFSDIDLTDKLTVPGTLNLIKSSKGLITCHSSLNIAAWHNNIPQILIYPEHVKKRHFLNLDEWSFGKDYSNTVHFSIKEFNFQFINKFKRLIL